MTQDTLLLQSYYSDIDNSHDDIGQWHRVEAMSISLIDFQWASAETKSFQ